MDEERSEQENQRRDVNYVIWLGKNVLPFALAALLLGIVFHYVRLVGT